MVKKIISFLKGFFVFLFVLVVLLEAGSYLYIRFVNTNIPMPTYSFVNAGTKFWVYIDEHFGVWHAPHSEYLHNKSCFVEKYEANKFGMRDEETTLESAHPRVAVLGDSFMEGWGNKEKQRVSELLEAHHGVEVLNFGTSGGFGTIQEWLQYKHLVDKFDHDVVLLGILPHNDFKDNDYELGLRGGDYRPYLKGDYPDYELVYSADALPDLDRPTPLLRSFDYTFREWSSFYRIMRYLGSYRIKDFKLVPRWQEEFEREEPKSHYYSFSEEEWDIMRYSLERLAAEVGDKKLIVFTIPVTPDFQEYDGDVPPLSSRIRSVIEGNGGIYVDLLEEMHKRGYTPHDLFFVCDNHWSPFGNEVAASILSPYVEKALNDVRRELQSVQ